jgi:polyphosphate glucokinase
VIIGGGNVDKLEALPKKSRVGKNTNAFLGGFRLWESSSKIDGCRGARRPR